MYSRRITVKVDERTSKAIDELVHGMCLTASVSDFVRKAIENYIKKYDMLLCPKCVKVGIPSEHMIYGIIFRCPECGRTWGIR